MSFASARDTDTKEQVRQAVDIVELVGSYLELRRQGHRYVALCPWHDDTRPSLQVNPARQSWKCWVCNVGGDAFSFVMQREGVEFREALQMLADRAGIPLAPISHRGAGQSGRADEKQTLYQAMVWAVQQFHDCLLKSPDAQPARDYLQQRGIGRDSIEKFRLGFSPNRWQWLCDRAGTTPFSGQVLETVGLVGRSSRSGGFYDRFKGRVIFPIRDPQGRPIALGGRILPALADDKTAKYVNSPETRLFSKSEHLYGLDSVRDTVTRSRHVVVVEGYTDVVMASQHGLDNVVAVLGTALGPRHIRVLRRFADTITLLLDGDEAGQRRANEVLDLFVANQVDLRIATLPDRLDPCDFLLQRGPEAFRQLLADGVDALEHKIRCSTVGLDPLRDTHRANSVLENLLQTLARAPQLTSDTTGQMRMRREQFLARLAREFRVDEAELRSRFTVLRRAARGQTGKPRPAAQDTHVTPTRLDVIERELFEILTQNPQLIASCCEAIPRDGLASPPASQIYGIFLDLHHTGVTPDFGRVLTELEDPQLKNLLVELDEQGGMKAEVDPERRLADVVAAYRIRQGKQQRQAALDSLLKDSSHLNQDQELLLLQQIIDRNRERQGISAPTDG